MPETKSAPRHIESVEPPPAQTPERERLLTALQMACLVAIVATLASRLWQDHIWVGFALVGATTIAWLPEFRRRRDRLWIFAYVVGTFVYALLRAYADETGIPVRTSYVIELDRALFLGADPVVRLQQRFFEPPNLRPLDWAAVSVHWSYFVAPHAFAVYIFVRRRELFSRFASMVLLTHYLALVIFFVVPTAPPWLAGLTGDLPTSGTYRIMHFVGTSLDPDAYRTLYESLGEPNSVAAMPSLHMSLTFAMFLFARRHNTSVAPAFFAYSLLMGFCLVYLAEHYVLDLIAGASCAVLAHAAAERVVAAKQNQASPSAAC